MTTDLSTRAIRSSLLVGAAPQHTLPARRAPGRSIGRVDPRPSVVAVAADSRTGELEPATIVVDPGDELRDRSRERLWAAVLPERIGVPNPGPRGVGDEVGVED